MVDRTQGPAKFQINPEKFSGSAVFLDFRSVFRFKRFSSTFATTVNRSRVRLTILRGTGTSDSNLRLATFLHKSELEDEFPRQQWRTDSSEGNQSGNSTMDADFVREKQKRRCFFSLVWILVLIFLAWPLAYAFVGFYIFLLPFEAVDPVSSVVKEINAFLEKFITWPRLFGNAIRDSEENFPKPTN